MHRTLVFLSKGVLGNNVLAIIRQEVEYHFDLLLSGHFASDFEAESHQIL